MFLVLRAAPRLLCTAAQQKSSGTGTEEENGAHKPDPSATEKALTEEKTQLEDQLKDVTVLFVYVFKQKAILHNLSFTCII